MMGHEGASWRRAGMTSGETMRGCQVRRSSQVRVRADGRCRHEAFGDGKRGSNGNNGTRVAVFDCGQHKEKLLEEKTDWDEQQQVLRLEGLSRRARGSLCLLRRRHGREPSRKYSSAKLGGGQVVGCRPSNTGSCQMKNRPQAKLLLGAPKGKKDLCHSSFQVRRLLQQPRDTPFG